VAAGDGYRITLPTDRERTMTPPFGRTMLASMGSPFRNVERASGS
jgi:hypothetical protein